jgi:sortase A
MTKRRHGVRAVLHFVASVLITSGVLMLLDAALTVTWQEPVSAFLAQRDQDRLDNQLDKATQDFKTQSPAPPTSNPKELARAARGWRLHLKKGDPVGRIEMPTLHRKYVVVQGTDAGTLRKGPGHYPKTNLPGEGGTVAIAGHRTTYLAPFRTVNKLKPGQQIVLDMPYGKFTYAVEKTQIVPPTQVSVVKRVPGAERLVLSACHPLYSASKRIIIFARLRAATG